MSPSGTVSPIGEGGKSGGPIPAGGCTSKTCSFSSTCKNLGVQHFLGAKIWSPEKVNFSGYDYSCRSPKLLDQSLPNFLPNIGGIAVDQILHRFWISSLFQRYSLPNFDVVQNSAKFCMFWPIKFFFRSSPQKFWTGIIKYNLLLIIMQNFMLIGRPRSEISRWNE